MSGLGGRPHARAIDTAQPQRNHAFPHVMPRGVARPHAAPPRAALRRRNVGGSDMVAAARRRRRQRTHARGALTRVPARVRVPVGPERARSRGIRGHNVCDFVAILREFFSTEGVFVHVVVRRACERMRTLRAWCARAPWGVHRSTAPGNWAPMSNHNTSSVGQWGRAITSRIT